MMAPTVFFDLDGTLLDTTYFHAYAWWRALDEAGQRQPMASIHPLIGMGGDELLTVLIGHEDGEISAAHARHFGAMHSLIRALPGAADLLRTVADNHGRVVVVTSAKAHDLDALLRPLACDDVISDVVHGDDVDRSKPAPDPFAIALARTGTHPDDGLAMGDSVWDVRAAAAVGMACLGVLTGGIAGQDLEKSGALAVYGSCTELLEGWESSPLGALLRRR